MKTVEHKGSRNRLTRKLNCVSGSLSTTPTQLSNPDPLGERNQLQRGRAVSFYNVPCLF